MQATVLPTPVYAITVFVSSGLLMMLEILAGRLLAPYIGVSLYTWTSIIGVILAGVSLGNWLGGIWSDRKGDERGAAIVLAICGTTCIAILLILSLSAPYLQRFKLDALSASFIYVCLLFFVPALLIGIITPLLTTLVLKRSNQPGHIIGMMHALAAAGSIAGTFLAGYWLIQYVGTHKLIIFCGVTFYLLAIPFFFGRTHKHDTVIVVLTIIIAFFAYQRQAYTSPCKKESQYFCIRVVSASDMAPFGYANAMVLDHLFHGANHATRPDMLIYSYVHAMDEIIKQYFKNNTGQLNYFFAGGGSYTHPRAVNALYPAASITVAEVDPAVTQVAKDFMYVDTNNMNIVHLDARQALAAATENSFDIIIGDVFHDVTLPYHLTTREYLRLVKSRLSSAGFYIMNIVDSDSDPKLVKSVLKTLQTEFAYVSLWLEKNQPPVVRQTYVISASNTHELPDTIQSTHGFNREWLNITNRIIHSGTSLDDLPILTDDFAPVERLIAALIYGR